MTSNYNFAFLDEKRKSKPESSLQENYHALTCRSATSRASS